MFCTGIDFLSVTGFVRVLLSIPAMVVRLPRDRCTVLSGSLDLPLTAYITIGSVVVSSCRK